MPVSENKDFIMPHDLEIIEKVIEAACIQYDISRKILMDGTSKEIVNIRYQCMYLISQNTGLYEKQIAEAFGKSRTTAQYGIGLIEIHKKIYRQTLGSMESIINITNSFTKKYQWHLQQINITH